MALLYSNSQSDNIKSIHRLFYLYNLMKLHRRRLRSDAVFDDLKADLRAYQQAARRFTGRLLSSARIAEIGFGPRPLRLMMLQSLGYDAVGIDLDKPALAPSVATTLTIARTNGFLRAAKTAVRSALFDTVEYRRFSAFLQKTYGRMLCPDPARMIVGDAALPETWDRAGETFDFVYSEDVFEHVPCEALPAMVDAMADRMGPNAVALVAPMVFTGICGGHDPGWYQSQVDAPTLPRGPAWGHLTDPAFTVDTVLNRMTRADYRTLFRRRFGIEREDVLHPGLGRRHLTPERRAALEAFGEDELFSNKVRFVLRKAA